MSEREKRYADAMEAVPWPSDYVAPISLLARAVVAVADAEQAELRAENDRIWAEVEKHLAEIERLRAERRCCRHSITVREDPDFVMPDA